LDTPFYSTEWQSSIRTCHFCLTKNESTFISVWRLKPKMVAGHSPVSYFNTYNTLPNLRILQGRASFFTSTVWP